MDRLYILKTSLPFLFALAWLAGYSTFKKNLAVFSDTGLAKQLIWLFPTAVFMGWRLIHYILYWGVYFTDAEIKARRITREYAVFEYAMYISLAIVVALIVIGFVTSRRKGDA